MDQMLIEFAFLLVLTIINFSTGVALIIHMLLLLRRESDDMRKRGRGFKGDIIEENGNYFIWDCPRAVPVLLPDDAMPETICPLESMSSRERIDFLISKARDFAKTKFDMIRMLSRYPRIVITANAIVLVLHLVLFRTYFKTYLYIFYSLFCSG